MTIENRTQNWAEKTQSNASAPDNTFWGWTLYRSSHSTSAAYFYAIWFHTRICYRLVEGQLLFLSEEQKYVRESGNTSSPASWFNPILRYTPWKTSLQRLIMISFPFVILLVRTHSSAVQEKSVQSAVSVPVCTEVDIVKPLTIKQSCNDLLPE